MQRRVIIWNETSSMSCAARAGSGNYTLGAINGVIYLVEGTTTTGVAVGAAR